jgi:hypothetical protein
MCPDLIGGSFVLKAEGEGPDDLALADEWHHHQSLEAQREADDLMKEGELREGQDLKERISREDD